MQICNIEVIANLCNNKENRDVFIPNWTARLKQNLELEALCIANKKSKYQVKEIDKTIEEILLMAKPVRRNKDNDVDDLSLKSTKKSTGYKTSDYKISEYKSKENKGNYKYKSIYD